MCAVYRLRKNELRNSKLEIKPDKPYQSKSDKVGAIPLEGF